MLVNTCWNIFLNKLINTKNPITPVVANKNKKLLSVPAPECVISHFSSVKYPYLFWANLYVLKPTPIIGFFKKISIAIFALFTLSILEYTLKKFVPSVWKTLGDEIKTKSRKRINTNMYLPFLIKIRNVIIYINSIKIALL